MIQNHLITKIMIENCTDSKLVLLCENANDVTPALVW